MATAEELINDIVTYDDSPEPHIVIGLDRRIIVPDKLKKIAVQYDHDIETVTFDCPRYWDNHDMSKMQIYINYINGPVKDSYVARNVNAEDSIMHFDWTLSRNATQYKGPITFLICIKKTNDKGEEVNHWNSELCKDMYVSEGLECVELVVEPYPDLITQLLERMTVVEGINVSSEEIESAKSDTIAAAEVAASAKEEVVNRADEFRNGYSNALKGSKSGEAVGLTDISPLEHKLQVNVSGVDDLVSVTVKQYGKNLLSYPYIDTTKTANGVTFTDNGDGSITIKGTATADTNFILSYHNYFGDETINAISNNATNGEYAMSKYLYYTGTTNVYLPVSIVVGNGRTVDETLYPQVVAGTEISGYEPYKEPITYTPNANGAVDGIIGNGENITLKTDTIGAVIDVEYNRDINKAFAELQQRIAELSGTI